MKSVYLLSAEATAAAGSRKKKRRKAILCSENMAVRLLFVALHADKGHGGEGFAFDMGQERRRKSVRRRGRPRKR